MTDLTDAIKKAEVLRGQRILILDIERIQGRAEVKFWDLGDFKNRRIHANDVTSWPRTICLAWRWYGEKRTHFAAEWLEGGAEAMLTDAWEVYDEADVVVGHNLAGFDSPHLRSAWRDLGFAPPRPYKTVDTLQVARKEFGDESKTLDALSKRLGLEGKVGAYSATDAELAVNGNKAAQNRLRRYNMADIDATEALYDALRGWIPSHPHVVAGEEPRCNQCGSTDLEENGTTDAVMLAYPLFRCLGCGANVKGSRNVGRIATTRGAK